MQLIDADKAQPGLTIVAQSQTGGKGQRGNTWVDIPGQSLLMSVITTPGQAIKGQFAFNALVAVTIANVLQKLNMGCDICIKWPNDIIVNDKKAGGILIENVLRGSLWTYCVIGLGLNVKQEHFLAELPFATSLKIASGLNVDMIRLRNDLSSALYECSLRPVPAEISMKRYNEYLYKRGQTQAFSNSNGRWVAAILGAETDGSLQVQLADGSKVFYHHGQVMWEW